MHKGIAYTELLTRPRAGELREVKSMRTSFAAVTVIAVLALSIGICTADPYLDLMGEAGMPGGMSNSWVGSTGLIMTPTATVAKTAGAIVSYHYVDGDPNSGNVFNANVGLPGGFEIGAAWLDDGYSGADDEGIINLKYSVPLDKFTGGLEAPAVAIGAWDITNEINRSYYIVLSTDIATGKDTEFSAVRLSLGFADSDVETDRMDGIFGGVELVPFQWWLAKAEYDGEDLNASLAYQASDWASVEVGTLGGDWGVGINAWTNW